jgi:hypothetical protein
VHGATSGGAGALALADERGAFINREWKGPKTSNYLIFVRINIGGTV